ncbi:putative olfactory receptor 2W6-like isoform 1 [Camelus ferus]|nr:putative olfactory receptor 2W6-like isoform 1 [Camelus ferus]
MLLAITRADTNLSEHWCYTVRQSPVKALGTDWKPQEAEMFRACTRRHESHRHLVKIMERDNDSYQQAFILVGFSDRPRLERILFAFILVFYILTLVGNTAIILLSILDSRLHTPMYFFLGNLYFLDLCFTTSIVPQLLWNLWGPEKTIIYHGCEAQLYIYMVLGSTECVLLAVMSYDRYVAVCRPLHYTVVMHPRLCLQLVTMAWCCGFLNSFVMCPQTMHLSRCGRHKVDHFLCEMPALIAMSCEDTMLVEASAFALGVALLLVPLSLVLTSYGMITAAVLRVKSAAGRKKAFHSCCSHLTVVILFYGTIIYMYLQPANSYSQDQGKFLTLFYTTVTPSVKPPHLDSEEQGCERSNEEAPGVGEGGQGNLKEKC